jgi:hypothetical protein
MGEAADDAIDRGMDSWLSGEYDDEEGWGYGGEGSYSCLQTCRYCRASGLHWNLLAGKWRLFSPAGDAHKCAPNAKEAFR